MKSIKPLYDRILIRRTDSDGEVTSGGIIIPDTAKDKGQMGEVVAVGEGRLLTDGKIIPARVKKGDTVFFGKYAGTEAGKDMLIIREDEILGIVE